MSKNMARTVQIMPDVLSQEVSGETVLLDLNQENYFGLNEVGTRIWQLLKSEDNLECVYKKLLSEYEVDESELRRDFENIINELQISKVITVTEI
jgi:hypothetical protein